MTINPIYVRGGQSARDDIPYTYVAGRVRVTINPVYVRCGQSARDDINDVIHTQLLYIIDRSVIIVIIIIIIIIIIYNKK